MPKLTKSVVEGAVARVKQYSVWCSELPGFGAYILPSGHRTYFVDYRNTAGVRRRIAIGRHGKLTAEAARKQAIVIMGRVMLGDDPVDVRASARKAVSVRDLCERYVNAMDAGVILGKRGQPKKQSTIYTDRGRILRHILPLLGSKLVRDIEQSDIHRFIRDVASGKTAVVEKTSALRGKSIVKGWAGTAARTAGLLGSLLSFAVSEGLIATNPALGVKRPAGNHRTRRLFADEYAKLGEALVTLDYEVPFQGPTAIRLLALTGCRSGEIVNLRWEEVDVKGQCLRLKESKEGASIRPIGRPALELISSVQRQPECQYVLAPVRGGEKFGGLPGAWNKVVERAGLTGVTPHTLRHSFASTAADMGFTESTIAAMLGHQAGSVTSRYIHHLDTVMPIARLRSSAMKLLRGIKQRKTMSYNHAPALSDRLSADARDAKGTRCRLKIVLVAANSCWKLINFRRNIISGLQAMVFESSRLRRGTHIAMRSSGSASMFI